MKVDDIHPETPKEIMMFEILKNNSEFYRLQIESNKTQIKLLTEILNELKKEENSKKKGK